MTSSQLSISLGQVIASRIREVRRLRGWSQETLAVRLDDCGYFNATQTTVAKVERASGDRAANLSIQHLLAFAAALNVAPVHLLTPSSPGVMVKVTGDVEVPAGRLRAWVRGQRQLREEPDDPREFYSTIPRDEFNDLLRIRDQARAADGGIPATAYHLPDEWPGSEPEPPADAVAVEDLAELSTAELANLLPGNQAIADEINRLLAERGWRQ